MIGAWGDWVVLPLEVLVVCIVPFFLFFLASPILVDGSYAGLKW